MYLNERSLKTLDELATWAEQYLMAHNKKLSSKNAKGRGEGLNVDKSERSPERPREFLNCYRCGGEGHRAVDCMSKRPDGRRRNGDRRISCYRCGGLGHEAIDCRSRLPSQPAPRSGPSGAKPPVQVHRVGCAVQLPEAPPQEPTGDVQVLELKSGGSIKMIHATACEIPNSKDKLPLVNGKVGGKSAKVLRDTGCTGVIVKKDLVSQDQLCGTYGYAMAFDRSAISAPIAKIRVDTPYYVGEVNALCFREPICELIIGNIPGARDPDDPNSTWGYVARTNTKEQETQTMERDIAEDLEAEEEWCELPGEGEQRNDEMNVNEDHVADFSEDEEKDCCSVDGRTVDVRRLEEIQTTPRLTTKRKVRSFLKLFNSYQDEIPSFAAISAPLRVLISKGQPNKIKWGEAQERAFRALQECLLKKCVSNLPTS